MPEETKVVPKVTMEMLCEAGLNGFGLQLFCESFANAGDFTPPFSFSFRGLRFTIDKEPGEEIDTRHH